jgi:hypothetical protein
MIMRKTTPVIGLTCAAGLMLSAAGPVLAHDHDKAPLRAQRVVMECGNDAATRRAFTREHGAAPVFVTAREVQSAQAAGEIWATPRCMTAREHARLTQSLADMARAR